MKKIILVTTLLIISGCSNRQEVNLKTQQKASPQMVIFGGNGESVEDAVVITGIAKQSDGIDAEYSYISEKYGAKNKGWRLVGQTIVQEQGKVFDCLEIEIFPSSEHRYIYFDVSAFPWKKR